MAYTQPSITDEKPETPFEQVESIFNAYEDGLTDDGINRDTEKQTALVALAYVLCRNFKAAEESAKEGVFSLGFKVTFDRNDTPVSVKAVSSCSRISKSDIELNCPQEEV